jgi:oligopeptide transport system ATP-binding protein
MTSEHATPVVRIENLTVHFRMRRGLSRKSVTIVHAADDVTLEIPRGQTLGLVGESGSGKTTVAEAVLQLNKPTSGRILLDGRDLSQMSRGERRASRRKVQIVFQDPHSSLDPRLTVHDVIAEPLRASGMKGGAEMERRIAALLELVGLGTQHLWRRPHEFSGGQCQRICIARAVAVDPKLVVLDEPTSALDVSVQARILTLLADLQSRVGLAYLLVTHDLAVVECVADMVAVMYLGHIVEIGSTDQVLHNPRHPYSDALLASIPSPDPEERSLLAVLEGDVPSATNPPSGCRFHTRCPHRMPVCETENPVMLEVADGVRRACHLPGETVFARRPLAAAGPASETGSRSGSDGPGR